VTHNKHPQGTFTPYSLTHSLTHLRITRRPPRSEAQSLYHEGLDGALQLVTRGVQHHIDVHDIQCGVGDSGCHGRSLQWSNSE
jgi:hypothetical protein